jgi:hypothetical protein
LLVGVIKSVVDFLLWMFRVHAVSTVGVVFPFVNGPAVRSATTSRIVGRVSRVLSYSASDVS